MTDVNSNNVSKVPYSELIYSNEYAMSVKNYLNNNLSFRRTQEYRRNVWKNIMLVCIGWYYDRKGMIHHHVVPLNIYTKKDVFDNYTVKKCRDVHSRQIGTKLYPCYEVILMPEED